MMVAGAWPASLVFASSFLLFGLWFLSRRDARLLDFGLGKAVQGPQSSLRGSEIGGPLLAAGSACVWLSLRRHLPGFVWLPGAAIPIWLVSRWAWRTHVAATRIREMRTQWPLLLESMSVAALSGLGLNTAFEVAAKRVGGCLRAEADNVVLRIGGGLPLSRALDVLVKERVPGAERLASVLLQCEVLGTPVAEVLESLALEAANLERQDMEAKFSTLPLKLSLITVVFLLPPVLIISIAPHVLIFLNTKW